MGFFHLAIVRHITLNRLTSSIPVWSDSYNSFKYSLGLFELEVDQAIGLKLNVTIFR